MFINQLILITLFQIEYYRNNTSFKKIIIFRNVKHKISNQIFYQIITTIQINNLEIENFK